MNYFLLLHIFQTTSVNARAALTHPASKFSKTSPRLDAFECSVLAVKDEIQKNLAFKIFLIVFYSFMDSHKDMNVNKFRIPTTKHFCKGGRCETFKDANFAVY